MFILFDFPVYDEFWPLRDVQQEPIPEDGGYEYEYWRGIVGGRGAVVQGLHRTQLASGIDLNFYF